MSVAHEQQHWDADQIAAHVAKPIPYQLITVSTADVILGLSPKAHSRSGLEHIPFFVPAVPGSAGH